MITFRKNEIGFTIKKEDIDNGLMVEYFEEVNKIERMKKRAKSRVEITIFHFHSTTREWYTLPEVRSYMMWFVREKPHIFYFLTEQSCIFVLNCMVDYKLPIKEAVRRDTKVQALLEDAIRYADKFGDGSDFAQKIYEISGYSIFVDF